MERAKAGPAREARKKPSSSRCDSPIRAQMMQRTSLTSGPRSSHPKLSQHLNTSGSPASIRAIRCNVHSRDNSSDVCSSSASSPVAPKIPSQPQPHTLAATATSFAASLILQGLVHPAAAHASEELSASSADALVSFFSYVTEMGPAGYLVFVLLVMTLEMVPLLPTQPLSLASGLLFGPFTGALVMLTGVSLAANNAFWISRGVGRKLAESVIKMETTDDEDSFESPADGKPKKPTAVAMKIREVEEAIEAGGPLQQLVAVMFLRLTPIVPFSASNYVLGLSPVLYTSYMGGTLIGMSGWSLIYASLGAGARSLFDSGVDLPTLFGDLAEKATGYSSTALKVSVVVGVLLGAVLVGKRVKEGASNSRS